MRTMPSARGRARHAAAALPRAVLVALVLCTLLAAPVRAHAELETAVPADGDTAEIGQIFVSLIYNEELVASRSSFRVLDPDGQLVLEGSVDKDDPTTMVGEFTAVAPGAYELRWTAVADDGHAEIKRGTLGFTVVEPPPTPSPTPTLAPSATPPPTPSPTASPSASPSLAPSPSPDTPPAAGGGDVVLPILAAVVILGGLAVFLLRRGRPA